MEINGQKFNLIDTFDTPATIPDCIVVNKNKLGTGHGEAKFYITSKEKAGMHRDLRVSVELKAVLAHRVPIPTAFFHPDKDEG